MTIEAAAKVWLEGSACDLFKTYLQNIAGAPEEASEPSFSVWMTSPFLKVVEDRLVMMELETFDSKIQKLSTEVDMALPVFQQICCGESTVCWNDFMTDATAINNLFLVGAGNMHKVHPTAAEASVKRAHSAKTLKSFKACLKTTAGFEILNRIGAYVQLSAKDRIADEGLKRAVACLADATSLHWVKSDDKDENCFEVDNLPMASKTIALVLESVVQVVDSITMWTPMGCVAAMSDLTRWSQQAVDKIKMWDHTGTVCLFHAVTNVLSVLNGSDAAEGDTRQVMRHRILVAQDTCGDAEQISVLLDSMVSQLTCVAKKVESDAFEPVLAMARAVLQHNSVRRTFSAFVMLLLSLDVQCFDTSVDVVMREWRVLHEKPEQQQ